MPSEPVRNLVQPEKRTLAETDQAPAAGTSPLLTRRRVDSWERQPALECAGADDWALAGVRLVGPRGPEEGARIGSSGPGEQTREAVPDGEPSGDTGSPHRAYNYEDGTGTGPLVNHLDLWERGLGRGPWAWPWRWQSCVTWSEFCEGRFLSVLTPREFHREEQDLTQRGCVYQMEAAVCTQPAAFRMRAAALCSVMANCV